MRKLRRTPKIQDGVVVRSTPVIDTYNRIKNLMPLVGITHVMEITELDVLGIPVCLAFGTKELKKEIFLSAGLSPIQFEDKFERVFENTEHFPIVGDFPDSRPIISIGKGHTTLDARVSAMMEAIERFSALEPSTQPHVASTTQMRRDFGDDFVHPRTLILISLDHFDEDIEIEWVPGFDLLADETVWVPADAATLNYDTISTPRICSDTATGLGAGNNYEEAICHALAEVIEHDAWTLSLVTHARMSTERFFLDSLFSNTTTHRDSEDTEIDQQQDAIVYLNLDSLESIYPLDEIVQKLQNSTTSIEVHDITSDIQIPSFSVALHGHEGWIDAGGLGTHPDSRIALLRALTEAAQQRLFLGIRDLTRGLPIKKSWQTAFPGQNQNSLTKISRNFQDVVSHTYADVLDDIQQMLAAIQENELSRIVVVDLCKPGIDVPVVKVIIPGMADYWTSEHKASWRALGPRVMRYFQ